MKFTPDISEKINRVLAEVLSMHEAEEISNMILDNVSSVDDVLNKIKDYGNQENQSEFPDLLEDENFKQGYADAKALQGDESKMCTCHLFAPCFNCEINF